MTASTTSSSPISNRRATSAACSARTTRPLLFRSVVPRYYPIPDDGPVGLLLSATGRHPYRPAHLHLIASAPGHRPVTTHMFVADSPYLDFDAVFGVQESFVRAVPQVDDAALAAQRGLPNPFRTLAFDLTRDCKRTVVRHEALLVRVEVGDPRRPVVVAVG